MKIYTKVQKRKLGGKPTKHFYVREYDNVTKRQRWINTACTARKRAMEFRNRLESEQATGKSLPDDITLADALALWLKGRKARKIDPRTYKVYKQRSEFFCDFFPKGTLLSDIKTEHVEDYFDARRKQVSATTCNHERTLLRMVFKWAFNRKLVTDPDPVKTVGKFPTEDRGIRALSGVEQEELLGACLKPYKTKTVGLRNAGSNKGGKTTEKASKWTQEQSPPPWLHPLVFLALKTGLRLGNLQALVWNEVDLKGAEIRIPAKKMKAKRDHIVPLDPGTVRYLKDTPKHSLSVVEGVPDQRAVLRRFQAAAKRAGLGKARFHDLRSTAITDVARSSKPEVAQRFAGHRDIGTTLKYYRHVGDDEVREAVKRRGRKQAEGRV